MGVLVYNLCELGTHEVKCEAVRIKDGIEECAVNDGSLLSLLYMDFLCHFIYWLDRNCSLSKKAKKQCCDQPAKLLKSNDTIKFLAARSQGSVFLRVKELNFGKSRKTLPQIFRSCAVETVSPVGAEWSPDASRLPKVYSYDGGVNTFRVQCTGRRGTNYVRRFWDKNVGCWETSVG